MFSACDTPVNVPTSPDVDGTAENVSEGASPSTAIDYGELIRLCANSLVAEGTLLGL